VFYAKRRPVGTPLTWGESMVAATYVFFLMFWVYGVVIGVAASIASWVGKKLLHKMDGMSRQELA